MTPEPLVLLTTDEAAAMLRFTGAKPAHAFRAWADRQGVPSYRRGRVRLYDQRVLLAYLRGDAWTRHASTVTKAS